MNSVTTERQARRRDGLARGIEIALGAVLGIAAFVPGALTIGALVHIFSGSGELGPAWVAPLVVVLSATTAFWCVETAWRLCTRRERETGGLLSPFVLRLAGVVCVVLAVVMLIEFGLPGLGRAAQCVSAALGLLAFADERVRVRLRRYRNGRRKR